MGAGHVRALRRAVGGLSRHAEVRRRLPPDAAGKAQLLLPAQLLRRHRAERRRSSPAGYEIGVDQITWGNDFPHPEGTWPHTRDWLRIKFHDCPAEETRKMLGLNALRCYQNFDAAKLAAVAERIGPSEAEIHDQPVPPNPDLISA